MKRSRNYWAGIVLLAIIPLLLIDIAEHNVNWKKEVREEMIVAVHNQYELTKEEKATVLDRILERNQELNFYIYAKSFACVILFAGFLYFLYRSMKQKRGNLVGSIGMAVGLMAVFMFVKIACAAQVGNTMIRFLPGEARTLSLKEIHQTFFRNKVLYVDFWGTTCGPCLKEFRDYTKPLKQHYSTNNGIAYLYVSRGSPYIWKQQLQKYDIEGDHLFLEANAYDKLYREAAMDTNVHITMPRYVILDRNGATVETDAMRPSKKDSLYWQIDRWMK